MCPNDNNADHATLYFNAQLGALWENAVLCRQHLGSHGQGDSPEYRMLRLRERASLSLTFPIFALAGYALSLAEYGYGRQRQRPGSTQDFMFHAIFGKPSLQFLCNHEVLLRLVIEEGHYSTDFNRVVNSPVANP